ILGSSRLGGQFGLQPAMVMSACSRIIPLCTSPVLKIFNEDSTRHLFGPGLSNFGRVCVCFVFSRHVWIAELRADCAVFWCAGRNRGLIRGCRITNNKYRVESFFVCASKRRCVGFVRGSTHSELFHTAVGLHLERQRSSFELRFLKQ